MLLINYDFYDIYALIVSIRSEPYLTDYVPALKDIIRYIESPQTDNFLDYNNIRHILKPYVWKEASLLQWAYTDNVYTYNTCIMKNPAHYQILSAVLRELITALKDNPERASLAADACHNIPTLLTDTPKPKKAILSMIADYRKQYNPDFLKAELKSL